MKKSSKIIISSILALGITGGAFAFGSHHYFSNLSMQEKAEMIDGRITKKLDLNAVQEDKLSQLTSRIANLVQQARENRQSHMQELDGLITDQPLDQALLLEKINQKTTMVNNHAPEIVGLLAGFVDSLDAEQKADIRKMIEKRRSHRFGNHGDRHDLF